MITKKSLDYKFWVSLAMTGTFYIFGAGVFYHTVQAHSEEIKTLKKELKTISKIQSQQHTIQSVQAEQMKWIVNNLKKNEGE